MRELASRADLLHTLESIPAHRHAGVALSLGYTVSDQPVPNDRPTASESAAKQSAQEQPTEKFFHAIRPSIGPCKLANP